MSILSGKKKAHKHKLFGPVALGTTPGMSQGKPGCAWDKPTLSQAQTQISPSFTQWEPSLSQGQTQFVPDNPYPLN